MSAKEMFEELNLEQIRNDDNYIEYVRNGLGGYISILFSLRWKSIKSTYGYQTRGMNYHEISIDELKAIICQAKELGWLEDEKQEIKQETNFEHYERLIRENYFNFALVNGDVVSCLNQPCKECYFYNNGLNCLEKKVKWVFKQYEKKYKLTQFEYDLLNAHKDSGMNKCISNYRPLLELHEKRYFKDIDTSIPIHEILSSCEVVKDENS